MADERRYYFAYGSNMDEKQMATRCPGSQLVGRGQLKGHSFLINERGVASVLREQNRVTHGLLWTVTPVDEEALDRYEGVAIGYYLKQVFAVYPNGTSEAVQAIVYVASNNRPGAPWPGYLERIIQAAREHALPPEYVLELESWKAGRKSSD